MVLQKSVIDKMTNHALDSYPEECCGIVTGDGQSQDVHTCQNIQNRLHQEDPERYPRDARTAYTIEREEAEKIFSLAKKVGKDVIAFYHSHTDHEAYFSKMDKEVQTVFGEPEFPEAIHIVISVKDREVMDMKCFIWDKEKRDFTIGPN